MTVSGICKLPGVMLFALSFCVLADGKIDPRDPSIWHEKSDTSEKQELPCEVFSSSVCPAYEDEKSDLQRERERREQRRMQTQFERR